MNRILAVVVMVAGAAVAESGQHSSSMQYAGSTDAFANREAAASSGWESSTTYSYPSESFNLEGGRGRPKSFAPR
jgi:hypothetical protein